MVASVGVMEVAADTSYEDLHTLAAVVVVVTVVSEKAILVVDCRKPLAQLGCST